MSYTGIACLGFMIGIALVTWLRQPAAPQGTDWWQYNNGRLHHYQMVER